ncbi:MAG TPA: hypothetical protein VE981_22230 [Planctomycetota bacterium]|nr:hypothetical protein [Planctomycetota bacterium]
MPAPAADVERIRERIASYRNGEDPDLSALCRALWETLYARIPSLTGTRDKNAQHRVLEKHLVELGLPKSPDLQYIAGPVLWYARERRVLPAPLPEDRARESWVLDQHLYEEAGKTLEEGRTAFGDWMTNALRDILAEQQ